MFTHKFPKKVDKLIDEFFFQLEKNGLIWPQKKILLRRPRRELVILEAGLNLFQLHAHDVYIDLLTDSGTAKMSKAQWLAMLTGDESYAGSSSWKHRLEPQIKCVFGFPYIIPVHQGRAAERLFFEKIISRQKKYVLGNTPFDTTRHWIENSGGVVVDCIENRSLPDFPLPFQGNVNLEKLEKTLKKYHEKTACILITITCNSAGGQPVHFKNICKAKELALQYKMPLFLDAARYAENAYLNCVRDQTLDRNTSVREINLKTMSYADGILVSAKKDCLGNIGGFMAFRDKSFYESLLPSVTAQEGNARGYGGMAGYTMESLTQGIEESLNKDYLKERVNLIADLADSLWSIGIPVLSPGGHGVFVDAGKFLPHIPWHQFPGHALAIELYREGGIRSVEIGSLMLGRDPKTGKNRQAFQELTRLAFPRRVYGKKECDYIFKIFERINKNKDRIRGVKFAKNGESKGIRHFDSRFKFV